LDGGAGHAGHLDLEQQLFEQQADVEVFVSQVVPRSVDRSAWGIEQHQSGGNARRKLVASKRVFGNVPVINGNPNLRRCESKCDST
jgi:hypothetical protein